ncbi:MAG: MBOAT family protein [Clostridia bacterium]|nr:MBOAT family protein [Clostridia bacterium]
MVFSSAVFLLIFLPVVLLAYYIAPERARNPVLLGASLLFYAWGEPVYILIMLFSTVFDYGNGLLLEYLDAVGKAKWRKGVLALSVTVNIGLLCFFKYTDFLIGTVDSLTGAGLSLLHIALPVGISFYTFQTLSYTIDVYRRQVKAQRRLLDFGMYICMFPQLIAGPIVRYRDIEAQLHTRALSADRICDGLFRFVQGLGKKVLLANSLGIVWDEIAALDGHQTAMTSLIGAAAYMLQIYFDFSGYSDMAIGIGKMLGFDFLENFRYPYESHSVTEFWRRWHISLGTWFREYLYIPLGGNRRGFPRQVVNLLIVWGLTGLWHGAGWNFLLWGLYFFALLVLEKRFLSKCLPLIPSFVSRLYTLAAVLVSWVIFASDDLSHALNYLASLLGRNGFADDAAWFYLCEHWLILAVGAFFSVSYAKTKYDKYLGKIANERVRLGVRMTVAAVLYAVSLLTVINSAYNPFLYFRF